MSASCPLGDERSDVVLLKSGNKSSRNPVSVSKKAPALVGGIDSLDACTCRVPIPSCRASWSAAALESEEPIVQVAGGDLRG